MRGHEEASGTKYVPLHLFDLWEKKDPVLNYENFLLAEGVLNNEAVVNIRDGLKDHIEEELKIALETAPMMVDTNEELQDVFAGRQVSSNMKRVTDNPVPGNLRREETARGSTFYRRREGRALPKYAGAFQPGFDGPGYRGVWRRLQGYGWFHGRHSEKQGCAIRPYAKAPSSAPPWDYR
jgi:2-oxoisovalerate dehydrogenase E1 component